ncbi:MAG: hypothetical protein R6V33_04640, partial [Pelovirga sp.]
ATSEDRQLEEGHSRIVPKNAAQTPDKGKLHHISQQTTFGMKSMGVTGMMLCFYIPQNATTQIARDT